MRKLVISKIIFSLLVTSSTYSFANNPQSQKTHKLAHERQDFHKFYKKLKALENRKNQKKLEKKDISSKNNKKTPEDDISTNNQKDVSTCNNEEANSYNNDNCFSFCSSPGKDLVSLCQPGMSFLRDSKKITNSIKALCSKDLLFHYSKVKNTIQNELNIQYSLDITILPQQINHRKQQNSAKKIKDTTAIQTVYAPNLNWDLFNCPGIGSGSIQVSYMLIRYWNNSASNLDSILGLQSSINDFTSREDQFSQFTYTQAFPGNLFTLVAGQYSLYAIDGGTYDNDQQTGFINYTLSQNGSATYSMGSLGAYLQIDPTNTISFQVGFQDAYNVLAENITLRNWGKGKFNFFGYGSWSPNCKIGSGQYSFLIYNTRKVPQQPSSTTGWSVNLSQNIGKKLNIFGRANGASGNAFPIQRSFIAGVALSNPLNRNSQDLIGLAGSVNRINKNATGTAGKIRKEEGVIEGIITIGIGNYLSFSPDLQILIHPAARPDLSSALAYGIRFNASL